MSLADPRMSSMFSVSASPVCQPDTISLRVTRTDRRLRSNAPAQSPRGQVPAFTHWCASLRLARQNQNCLVVTGRATLHADHHLAACSGGEVVAVTTGG